jgi:four helix bundle protein
MTATFPRTGYRSLREQIVAAAESIPFNIAEGCGASSQKEFARFLELSIKSANELEAELQLTLDYGIVEGRIVLHASEEVVEVRRMLLTLRRRVRATLS